MCVDRVRFYKEFYQRETLHRAGRGGGGVGRDQLENLSPNFWTFKEPKESIPPAYVACRAGTTILFLLGS
jgi:hypothetical protein